MWGSEKRLEDYLHARLQRALVELAGIDPDAFLSENTDVLVAGLLERHMPTEIVVDWNEPSRTPVTEVVTQERDRIVPGRVYRVPASKLVVSFPISGSAELLDYQASTFSISEASGKVSAGRVVVEIIERRLDAEMVRSHIERVQQDIDKRAEWANIDLRRFRSTADRSLRNAHESRKARLLNDRAVEEALGIPVHRSSAPRPPVPARRKQVALQERRTQAAFVPEPVLDEAIYQDIVGVARSWANSLERTPGTANKLDEEELRDLLLGNLNGYWEGAATGELFNGSGKTDILIREGDRNAFIAECKIWRGPKSVGDAVSQLLSYLVWRDSKAALIIFIKTVDPAASIEKLHAAVVAHPSYVLTKEAADTTRRVDYIVTADGEGRRVSLAVLPVVIRSETT